MASLSRYTIRAGIIFAIIVTIFGLISTSVIINTVQNNVNVTQDRRFQHLSLDDEIQSQIIDVSQNIANLLSQEIQFQLINVLSKQNNNIDANFQQTIIANLSRINHFLALREQNNYNLTGLSEGTFGSGTLGVAIPTTRNIIDRSAAGAFNSYGTFIFASRQLIEGISNSGSDLRTALNDIKSQINTQNGVIEDANHVYQDAYYSFRSSLYDNGTTQAIDVLNSFRFFNGNMSELAHHYHSLYIQMADNPTAFDTTAFSNMYNTTYDNILAINDSVIATGLNSADQATFGEIVNASLNLFSEYKTGLLLVKEFKTTFQDDFSYITDSVLSLKQNFADIFELVHNKITEENKVFDQRTQAFVTKLRANLNQDTFLIIGILAAVVFIIFMWIFFALSLNIGRIVNKITSLEDGDLRIETRNSYGKHEIGIIESSLDTFATQIRRIITAMKTSSETLAGISEELAAGAEEASASINEVNSTVRNFTSGSTEQTLMLSRVRDELLTHLDVVEQTANSIDETAKFVLRVAKRTNILGLNASIEAAKAGRFGLGFDVVANEVRKLSNETRESASTIAGNIEDIEFSIRKTVEEILNEVNIIRDVAQNTSRGSEDASVATQEQVTMMNEVSETSSQLSEISQSLNEMMQNFEV